MHDDPLSILALRYAARDLPPVETAAFEVRLATDRSAQDALAEAVRLSAAALGRKAPAPMAGLRGLIADRLSPVGSTVTAVFRRRAYHGHPMAWAGLGAVAAAAAVTAGVWLGEPTTPTRPDYAATTSCPSPEVSIGVEVKPVNADPVPTASVPLPQPMTPGATAAVAPPSDEKNPMTSAAGPTTSSGGGGEAAPPANRAKNFLPETDPPGRNPDDTFAPFEPPTRS